MTKRQVVRQALNHQSVPYVPWSFHFTKEARDKLIEHYGTDDIHRTVGNHIIELGSHIGFFEDVGNDRVRDFFGVIWDRSVDKDIGNVEGCVLPESTLDGYTFPDPLDHRFFDDLPKKIEANEDCFRLFCLGFSLYERAWTLRGMTNLLMDFYDNPGFVHELLDSITDYNIAQVEKAMEYDIDAVYFGDDWGQQHGLIMGYDLWREFIYPQLKRMYGFAKDNGKIVFIHSCGDVDELFDDLVDIGLDCFNPFQPEVMDCESLHSRYAGRLSFWGGLSTQKTLPFGAESEVRETTRRLIDMGMQGSYILAPAHAVEGDVSLENMRAFIEEVQNQPGAA
ncbi:uroporphyrinogen decarboxylase family protein [Candidatus Hydrogenedentota bacterium]